MCHVLHAMWHVSYVKKKKNSDKLVELVSYQLCHPVWFYIFATLSSYRILCVGFLVCWFVKEWHFQGFYSHLNSSSDTIDTSGSSDSNDSSESSGSSDSSCNSDSCESSDTSDGCDSTAST